MGALHCVTDNHMHIYTAQTSGEVKDMRHPLRFRTSTRGFDTTVEQQQAVSRPCPRKASAEEAGWHQARVVREEAVAARRRAARSSKSSTFLWASAQIGPSSVAFVTILIGSEVTSQEWRTIFSGVAHFFS